jgi:hypothetical protein
MPLDLTPESQAAFARHLKEGVSDFIGELIGSLYAVQDVTYNLRNALSPNWEFPKIFDDTLDLFGAVDPDPWIDDYPVDQYDGTVFESAPAGTVIEGPVIARNTANIVLISFIGVILTWKTGLKMARVMAFVYDWFFGTKAQVLRNQEMLDELYDLLNDALDLDRDASQFSEKDLTEVLNNQENIQRILKNADTDITGVIKALLHDRREYLVDVDWDVDVVELVTQTPTSEDGD